MRFRKKIVICSHDFPFWVAILCVVVERRSQDGTLTNAKIILKKKRIRSPNDAWKGYLKTWDRWNSQSFQWHFALNPTSGVYSAPYEHPASRVQRADAPRWVMAYGHKAQSFMKKGGQQKCLNKALMIWSNIFKEIYEYINHRRIKQLQWYSKRSQEIIRDLHNMLKLFMIQDHGWDSKVLTKSFKSILSRCFLPTMVACFLPESLWSSNQLPEKQCINSENIRIL